MGIGEQLIWQFHNGINVPGAFCSFIHKILFPTSKVTTALTMMSQAEKGVGEQKDACKLGQPHFLTFFKASVSLVVSIRKQLHCYLYIQRRFGMCFFSQSYCHSQQNQNYFRWRRENIGQTKDGRGKRSTKIISKKD